MEKDLMTIPDLFWRKECNHIGEGFYYYKNESKALMINRQGKIVKVLPDYERPIKVCGNSILIENTLSKEKYILCGKKRYSVPNYSELINASTYAKDGILYHLDGTTIYENPSVIRFQALSERYIKVVLWGERNTTYGGIDSICEVIDVLGNSLISLEEYQWLLDVRMGSLPLTNSPFSKTEIPIFISLVIDDEHTVYNKGAEEESYCPRVIIYDTCGNILQETEYCDILSHNGNLSIVVDQYDNEGIIDADFKEIIPCAFRNLKILDELSIRIEDNYESHHRIIKLQKGSWEIWGDLPNGNFGPFPHGVSDYSFDSELFDGADLYVCYGLQRGYNTSTEGLINKNGVLKLPLKYARIDKLTESVYTALHISDEKHSLLVINDGELICTEAYDIIEHLYFSQKRYLRTRCINEEGLFLGLLDRNGKELLMPELKYIGESCDDRIPVLFDDYMCGIIDLETGKTTRFPNHLFCHIVDNLIFYVDGISVHVHAEKTVKQRTYQWWCHGYVESEKTEEDLKFGDIFLSYVNPTYGFMTLDGKNITTHPYSDIREYRNGLMYANDGGLWGIIDSDDNVIVPFEYDNFVSEYDMSDADVDGTEFALWKENEIFCFDAEGEFITSIVPRGCCDYPDDEIPGIDEALDGNPDAYWNID